MTAELGGFFFFDERSTFKPRKENDHAEICNREGSSRSGKTVCGRIEGHVTEILRSASRNGPTNSVAGELRH
jgi:hypothetical protein